MNLDKIFDLLHCDIDVLVGLKGCNNNLQDYEELLSHFIDNSAFDVLDTAINGHDFLNAKRIARLLIGCADKLGMLYISDLLHDLLGSIQSLKWTQASKTMQEIKNSLDAIKATLQDYETPCVS